MTLFIGQRRRVIPTWHPKRRWTSLIVPSKARIGQWPHRWCALYCSRRVVARHESLSHPVWIAFLRVSGSDSVQGETHSRDHGCLFRGPFAGLQLAGSLSTNNTVSLHSNCTLVLRRCILTKICGWKFDDIFNGIDFIEQTDSSSTIFPHRVVKTLWRSVNTVFVCIDVFVSLLSFRYFRSLIIFFLQ